MKRSLFTKPIKQTFLAVSTSALMLGAAHAGTTIGINFAGGSYATYGYAAGFPQYYCGFPVTATAFGVAPSNWNTTTNGSITSFPYNFDNAGTIIAGPASSLTVNWTTADCWGTHIGQGQMATNAAGYLAPPAGNDEVTWGMMDNTGWSISLSGLNATFPNGYVIQGIGAGKVNVNSVVNITDGASYTAALGFNPIYTVATTTAGTSSVGLQTATPTLTSDAIAMSNPSRPDATACALAGFIVTDVPVVTYNVPANVLVSTGTGLVLAPPPGVIGIGLTYQWQHAGTNLPGATFGNYTNSAVAATDAGDYSAVVTSTYFPSMSVTGEVATVVVVPPHPARTATFDANTAITGAQDGSGTWGYTLTNWWSGSFDDFWGNPDSAVFGAGGTGTYTVALTANLTANSITFNSGAYTITNTSGQTLTLSGLPAVTANTNGTITVPVTIATNIFVKAGTGYLTLAGALTCTNAFVSAGTLEVQSKVSDLAYVVTNGATLKIGYSTSGGYANTGLQLYGNGTNATTGLYLLGGKTYNVSGGVVVNGAPTTIRQYGSGPAGFGIFDINSNPGLSITAAASGSVLDANIQMVNDGYGMVITTAPGANTATGDLILNGPLNINDNNFAGGLNYKGTGSLRLNAVATTNNSGLRLLAGTVLCGITNCIGTNAFLDVRAGATLDLNGTSQTVSYASLNGIVKMTINKGGTPNCNNLNCWSQSLVLGGTLVVTNLGGTVALGDTFTLFSAANGFGGGFTNLILPAVPNGLAWQDNSTVDGTIQVITGSVPPSIVTDLSDTTNYAYVGGSASFAITASGDPILHYIWLKNGVTHVGTDSPTLTLMPVTLGDDADYSVTVTNNFGSAYSMTNHLTVITSGYGTIVTGTGPLAYWPLNEDSGTTAFDDWGGYNAAYLGGYALNSAVNPATGTDGAHFDGATGRALTPYSAALNPAVFTASAWVNPDATPSSEYCVLSCGQFASPRSGWLIYQFPNYWDLRTYYGNGTSTAVEVVGTSTPTLGSWEHLAVSWDGTTARLYVNGVLEGSTVSSTTPKYLPGTSSGFCVGARADNSFWFPGTVSDVALYSRALTAREISALALTGPPVNTNPTNLTASVSSGNLNLSWPLDHTSWRLLEQTNHLAAGISSNPNDWDTVSGSAGTNQVSIPITTTKPSEFYRLVYP